MSTSRLHLFDYYKVSVWPTFLLVLTELFLFFNEWDVIVDKFISHPLLNSHWVLRLIFFVYIGYLISYTLRGNSYDGMIAGSSIGFFVGLLFGLFRFIRFPEYGTFITFLALPFQTLFLGFIVVGGVTFFLFYFIREHDKL